MSLLFFKFQSAPLLKSKESRLNIIFDPLLLYFFLTFSMKTLFFDLLTEFEASSLIRG